MQSTSMIERDFATYNQVFFGDFIIRKGIVKAMYAGRLWWSLPEV